MRKKDLLKQLNNLQSQIKPDQKWLKSNREILYSQITAQTKQKPVNSNIFSVIFDNQILRAFVKPALTVCGILVLILSSWIATTNATKNSLPGDFFYPLKLTTERVQVNLTLDDEKRTNMELQFAERRLDEVNKVSETADTKNKGKVEVALQKFQESMVNVKSNLAKLEIKDTKTAVKVADLLDKKAMVYVNLLQENQAKVPELAAKATEAISASKATADKALSLIIKESEQSEPEVSAEDVKAKVQARITEDEENINNFIGQLKQIETNLAKAEEAQKAAEPAAEPETPVTEPTAETPVPTAETPNTNEAVVNTNTEPEPTEAVETPETLNLAEVKDKPQEALKMLAEAKDLLAKGETNSAFEKIKQLDDILLIIDKFIQINSQYLDAQQTPVENQETPATEAGETTEPEPANTNTEQPTAEEHDSGFHL